MPSAPVYRHLDAKNRLLGLSLGQAFGMGVALFFALSLGTVFALSCGRDRDVRRAAVRTSQEARRLPEGASRCTSVPPPAPEPITITSYAFALAMAPPPDGYGGPAGSLPTGGM